jgi:hypothetical protein
MEHPYIYKDEIIDTNIKGLGAYIPKFEKRVIAKKIGGINDPKTEIRSLTIKLLSNDKYKVTMGMMGKLTKGWSLDQLEQVYKAAVSFAPNPGALWWKIWKEKRDIKKSFQLKRLFVLF